MFKKLQRQLMLICAIGTGLVLILMAVVSYYFAKNQMNTKSEESFNSSTNTVLITMKSVNVIDNVWISQIEGNENLYLSVDYMGKPIDYTGLNEKREIVTQQVRDRAVYRYGYDSSKEPLALTPETIFFTIEEEDSYRASVTKLPYKKQWVTVIIVRDMSRENAQLAELKYFFIATVIVALGLLSVFAWLFTGKAMKPIVVNQKKQTEFVSSASHELRSPLAVIQATAGAMKYVQTKHEVESFRQTIEDECVRMGKLTEDLLSLAGAEKGSLKIKQTLNEPETTVLRTAERYEFLSKEKDISIKVSLPPELLPLVSYDKHRIEQLLGILMDNAIEYTPVGGEILLSANTWEKKLMFSVGDSGAGVPESERDKIFDRFYRSEASRTNKKHYGLGLSIAVELARLHKGKLSVGSSVYGGADFLVELPT